MKKLTLLFSCMAVFIFSSLTNSFAANGWYGPMKVKGVTVHGHYYLIETNSTIADCNQPGRFTIKSDASLASDMYNIATLAWLTNRDFYIYVDAAQGCQIDGMVSILVGVE